MRLLMISWSKPTAIHALLPWRLRWWRYFRLANAGELLVAGRLRLCWPMPWHRCVKDDPAYTHGRPSGVLSFIGWYDVKGGRR